MKSLAINVNGNAITSFARELNPTGVGEYIYLYIVIHRQICFVLSELISVAIHTRHTIYIYIYTHRINCGLNDTDILLNKITKKYFELL